MKFDFFRRARTRRSDRTQDAAPAAAIERLEDRIAPAAINPLVEVPNPGDLKIEPGFKTAYYHDVDGDIFLIKTTKGAFSDGLGANPNKTFLVDGSGVIERIDLSFANFNSLVKGVAVANFQGTSISTTLVAPTKANGLPVGGDGRLNVGYVNATGVDIAGVTIRGDVTRIDAGDGNDKTTGLGTLSVQSMGTLGLTTQTNLPGTDAARLTSHVHGRLNVLRVFASGKAIVHQGMQDVFIDVTSPDPDPKTAVIDAKYGAIGSVSIDALEVTNTKSAVLVGGVPSYTPGSIRASGAITTVVAGYSVAGGNADYSGDIWSRTSIGTVTLSGKTLPAGAPAATLTGGAGFYSGSIVAGNPDTGAAAGKLGAVKINKVGTVAGSGSVFGGGGVRSGTLFGDAGIASVYLGGDLKGGAVAFSGAIVSGPGAAPGVGVGLIGPVTVRGSILGGTGVNSGSIQSAAGITSVLVYGDEKGGKANYSGSIVALGGNIASITVKGELDSDPAAARDKTGIFIDGVLTKATIGAINPHNSPGVPTQYGAIAARGLMDKYGNVVPGTAIGTLVIGTTADPANTHVLNYWDVAAGFDHVFDSSNAGLPGAINNPDATIGSVTVNGTVFALTVSAGTNWGANKIPGPDIPVAATPTSDDTLLPFPQSIGTPITIAKIVITGAVTGGDPNSGNETVFEGAKLGTVSIGGFAAPAFADSTLTQIVLFSHAYLLQIAG